MKSPAECKKAQFEVTAGDSEGSEQVVVIFSRCARYVGIDDTKLALSGIAEGGNVSSVDLGDQEGKANIEAQVAVARGISSVCAGLCYGCSTFEERADQGLMDSFREKGEALVS